MTDKRLLYRVIMKLMAVVGIIALLGVFLNAAFNSGVDTEEVTVVPNEVVTLKLAMVSSTVPTHVVWNGQRVGVIKRDGESQLGLIQSTGKSPEINQASVESHPWRSVDASYFVYIDRGDSGHCPLFFNGKVLKDTCSGNRFDLTGRRVGGTQMLAVPPHYFAQAGQLVIGRWMP
ncbi:MAG: hypothetical protein CSB47_01705 [Proteobacteria bacterium]|nr:MAG: hypothetical protein CSB47_01705 [Pseudomonadota bacterium]